MLELCQPGEDAHSYMGSQVAGVEYRDLIARVKAENVEAAIQRKLGKFCNLSYQFRISHKTATIKAKVEYGLNLEEMFVKASLNMYKRSYPGVPHYWQEAIFKSSKCGYAETFAGRRINLNGDWRNKKTSWALESTAINYPVQGSGGEMKYLALAVAKSILLKYSSFLYFELHDGIYVISPRAKTKACFMELRRVLSNLPYKQIWGREFPIKFPVDGKVGNSWGQLREPAW
jgi:DNA polymerase I-like protein with 3'-5' exonuclease and polymerase domains